MIKSMNASAADLVAAMLELKNAGAEFTLRQTATGEPVLCLGTGWSSDRELAVIAAAYPRVSFAAEARGMEVVTMGGRS